MSLSDAGQCHSKGIIRTAHDRGGSPPGAQPTRDHVTLVCVSQPCAPFHSCWIHGAQARRARRVLSLEPGLGLFETSRHPDLDLGHVLRVFEEIK